MCTHLLPYEVSITICVRFERIVHRRARVFGVRPWDFHTVLVDGGLYDKGQSGCMGEYGKKRESFAFFAPPRL
jgi:hypothetical protein